MNWDMLRMTLYAFLKVTQPIAARVQVGGGESRRSSCRKLQAHDFVVTEMHGGCALVSHNMQCEYVRCTVTSQRYNSLLKPSVISALKARLWDKSTAFMLRWCIVYSVKQLLQLLFYHKWVKRKSKMSKEGFATEYWKSCWLCCLLRNFKSIIKLHVTFICGRRRNTNFQR